MRRLRTDPGDVDAWTDFLAIYAPQIDRWCRLRGLQEADVQDVTQNILMTMAKQFGRFEYDPTRSFRGWLRTVTENAVRDYVKSCKTKPLVGDSAVLDSVESRQSLLEHLAESFDLEILAEARIRVQQKVDGKHWEVFELATDQQVSGADIASRLDISIANVFQIKSRIQRMIRDQIQQLEKSTDGSPSHGC